MEDDKDRLGNKLRDKEKATEDIFIEAQERERLARMRAAERSAGGVVGSGACPRDGDKLVTTTAHGLSIDVCPTCRGLWLDNGELETILKHEDEASVTRWLRTLLGR